MSPGEERANDTSVPPPTIEQLGSGLEGQTDALRQNKLTDYRNWAIQASRSFANEALGYGDANDEDWQELWGYAFGMLMPGWGGAMGLGGGSSRAAPKPVAASLTLASPTVRRAMEKVYGRSATTGAPLAANGGAGPVRTGQAGERAVQNAYQIGDKTPFNVLGRDRIADGLTDTTISEVKNVGYQGYAQQLKDYVTYSIDHDLRFDLYVRRDTRLSGPLKEAIGLGQINRSTSHDE